jgi:hypothetical protein
MNTQEKYRRSVHVEAREALEDTSQASTDFEFHNEGSILLVTPNTERAREWLEANVQGDKHYFGRSLVVEPRYAIELAYGILENGYSVC